MGGSSFTSEYQALLRRLVEARRTAGLTQQQVADRLKRPQSFVSKYERGERRLDVIEFLHVAKALDADAVALLRRGDGRSTHGSQEDKA